MNNNFRRAFESILSDQPYAFHPILSRICNDAKSGIFLNYLCHWGFTPTAKSRGGWFYQSVKDVYDHTALSPREQATARFNLRELGFVEMRRGNPSGTWNYRINMEAIAAAIETITTPAFSPLDDQATFDTPEMPDDYIEETSPVYDMQIPQIPPSPGYAENAYPDMRKTRIGYAENANPDMRKTQITVNETVNETVNPHIAPINGASLGDLPTIGQPSNFLQSEKPTKLTVAERKRRTLKAMVTGINSQSGPNCVNFPADTEDFAKFFIRLFGREPIKSELGYWIREIRTWRAFNLTESDLQSAYEKMDKENLTIKSPKSLTTIAWNIHQHSGNGHSGKNEPVAMETY